MRDSRWLLVLFLFIFASGIAFGYIIRPSFQIEFGTPSPISITTIPPSTAEEVTLVSPTRSLTCLAPALLLKRPEALMTCLASMDEQADDDHAQINKVRPRETLDYDKDGQEDRQDFTLDASGRVILSSYNREGVFDVAQFDFDADGSFEVAWFDMAPRDGVFDTKMYDVDGDWIADFARADVDFDNEFDQVEVFAYDFVDGRWKGAVPGAPDTLPLSRSWPFFPLQFPFPFIYPG
jgi:hypothetical protein